MNDIDTINKETLYLKMIIFCIIFSLILIGISFYVNKFKPDESCMTLKANLTLSDGTKCIDLNNPKQMNESLKILREYNDRRIEELQNGTREHESKSTLGPSSTNGGIAQGFKMK